MQANTFNQSSHILSNALIWLWFIISKKTLNMFFNGNTIAFLNTHSVFFYVCFRFSIHRNSLKHLHDHGSLPTWIAKQHQLTATA